MLLQTACYGYGPLQTVAPAGPADLGLVVNDRGRVLLADRMGASVDRIDGRVVSIDSTSIVLNVHRVTDIRGVASTWTGERVTIPRDALLGFRPRTLSKTRTAILIGGIAAAIAATVTASLSVFGDPRGDDGPGDPSQATRIPRTP
jgi:hypothetical protein